MLDANMCHWCDEDHLRLCELKGVPRLARDLNKFAIKDMSVFIRAWDKLSEEFKSNFTDCGKFKKAILRKEWNGMECEDKGRRPNEGPADYQRRTAHRYFDKDKTYSDAEFLDEFGDAFEARVQLDSFNGVSFYDYLKSRDVEEDEIKPKMMRQMHWIREWVYDTRQRIYRDGCYLWVRERTRTVDDVRTLVDRQRWEENRSIVVRLTFNPEWAGRIFCEHH